MPKKIDFDYEEEAKPAPVMTAKVVYYTAVMWKDVRIVFRCETCGTNRDDEDGMIEHVLTHHPLEAQEELLEQLLKEKNKWQTPLL